MTGAAMLHGEGTIIVDILFDGHNWTDVTADVMYDAKLNITQGRSDETSQAQPAQCTFSLLNKAGNYTPYDPRSIYWPGVTRNTPVRARFASGAFFQDGFESGVAAWTPFSGTFTQDATHVNSGSQAAKLVVTGTPSSTGARGPTTAAVPGTSYQFSMWVFATSSTTNVQATLSFLDASHTTIVDDVTTITVPPNVWTQVAVTGTAPALTAFAVFGPTLTTSPATGKTIWVDDVAFSMTPVVLFFGYAVGFTPAWDTSANKATVNVVAAGTLRRLTQGKSPLQSPLTRAILATGPTAYWPMDEPSGSIQARSAVVGVPALFTQTADPVFGVDGPGGAAFAVDFGQRNSGLQTSGSPTAISPLLLPPSSATSFRFEVSLICPITDVYIFPIGLSTDGDINQIGLQFTSTNINVHTIFADSTSRNDVASLNVNDGIWHRIRFDVADSGANITYAMSVDGASVLSVTLTSLAFGQVRQIKIGSSSGTLTAGNRLAATAMSLNQPIPLSTATVPANTGYTGETADARIVRVCNEQNVGNTVTGTSTTTMGPQPIAAFVDILRDCENTDGGVLYDGFDNVIGYICRSSRYNLAAAITADMSAGQVAPGFGPVDDDQRSRNDVTVSRTGGGSAEVIDSTSALGTTAIGVYDTSITVNTDTDVPLPNIAGWQVHLGTVQGLRYPTLPFDLVASPALITSWLNAGTISFRADVTNVTSEAIQHPLGTVSVIVEGYSMVLDLASWNITANCSPFAPWVVALYDTARYDSGSSTLTSLINTTATSLSVTTANALDLWTTSSGARPFNIKIDGEIMTVTNLTSATSPQTFTVTRSVNGIVQGHSAGAQVHVDPLPIYGL